MRRITQFTILLLSISLNFKSLSQEQVDKFDPNEKVYWFYLSVSIKLDKEMNRDVYVVQPISQKPKYGTFAVYEKEVWKCLKSGRQLAIGPFRENKTAKQAIDIYKLAKLTNEAREKEVEKLIGSTSETGEIYFCYYMKFDVTKRIPTLKPKRIPARTSIDGISLKDFFDQFSEGLTMQMLAIGPFASRPEAEESKRLNRLEEK